MHNTPKGPSKAEKAAMEEANRRKKVQIAKVSKYLVKYSINQIIGCNLSQSKFTK